jgi:hypothetical protein
MRCLAFRWLAISMFSLGCKPATEVRVTIPRGNVLYGVVRIDESFSYLIDPRTESCILRFWVGYSESGGSSVLVDCAKLKKNLPEAAKFITWLPDVPAAATLPVGAL